MALCDVDTERLGAAAAEFGVERTYSDYRAMLDEENLDIVNIPTRTDLHAPLTIGVLEHRAPKAVIVEKPMATSLTDADRMLELAQANGTRLAIHHQMRTTPTFQVAERLINDGAIGPITTFKIRGKGYYGGYDMLNIGTHMLNGTRRFAGDARSVVAMCLTGGRPTTAADIVEGSYGFGLLAGEHISALYEFENGLTAFAEMHRRSEPGSGWVHVKIYGEDGALCLYNSRELFVRRGARRGGGRRALGEVRAFGLRAGFCTGTTTTTTWAAICGWPRRRFERLTRTVSTNAAAWKVLP